MSNEYTTKNIEIRKMLQDIVGVAYQAEDANTLEKYKKFFLEISNKKVRSYAGKYRGDTKCITIVGLNRPSKHIVITSIHELSHHIDYCNRGTSDHKNEFYAIYEKLMHAALDMGIITTDDIMLVSDVTDLNKIKKFLDSYTPVTVSYKADKSIILVSNAFAKKDLLKARGYKWDSLEKCWKIETEDVNQEKAFLSANDLEYVIRRGNDINVQAKGKIIAKKGTYEYTSLLKENGFFWNKQKKQWEKNINLQDYDAEVEKLKKNGLDSISFHYC